LGAVCFDVGFSPILPFGTTLSVTGLESLSLVLNEITAEIWQDVAIEFIGLFASYTVAKLLSLGGEIPGLAAIAVKGVAQWILFTPLLLSEKAGSGKMIAASIANVMMGLIALGASVGETFARFLWTICTAPAISVLMLAVDGTIKAAAPLEIIRTRVDYIESLVIDFPMALVAFARYSGWI
jgi:hypothetical protein